MEANKAPEKIYLFENPITEVPDDKWLSKRSDEYDIEYTRTDAFIKKAEKYLREHLIDYWSQEITDEHGFIAEFKQFMKGE
jgi:Txe/YoeB family toxin of Txe-Axe toxin-antitoxin module